MFLQRLRLGFATNSSSSHSLIWIPGNTKFTSDRLAYDGGWGWDEFVLATPKAKASYLLSNIYNNLLGIMNEDYAKAVVEHVLAKQIHVKVDSDMIGYVDHQSSIILPHKRGRFGGRPDVDMEFFTNVFTEIVQSPDYVIIGGNDNSDNESLDPIKWAGEKVIRTDDDNIYNWLAEHSNSNRSSVKQGRWGERYSKGSFTARRDGRFWTMFNTVNGAKITLTTSPVSDKDAREAYTYSTVPELIDLKITDFCTKGCEFCYANSKHDGKHASLDNVRSIVYALDDLGVFEVTLGGGEPTLHPDFYKIVKEFNDYGIVVNFTTNDHSFLSKGTDANEREKREIMKLVGAVAVTVRSLRDCELALRFNERCGGSVVFQIPMGTVSRNDFHNIGELARASKIRMTLLGYKNVGRGGSYKPIPYDWWLDEVVETAKSQDSDDYCWLNNVIGIDTTLAAQYKDKLEALGVPEYMYYLQEGNFSCAIDAVNMTVAKSSYDGGALSIKPTSRLVGVANMIKKHYATFREA